MNISLKKSNKYKKNMAIKNVTYLTIKGFKNHVSLIILKNKQTNKKTTEPYISGKYNNLKLNND